jgi:sec-independent protein translocase protein TatC
MGTVQTQNAAVPFARNLSQRVSSRPPPLLQGLAKAPMSKVPHASMSLGQHLEDLRRRLAFAILGLVPILVLSLTFGKSILEFLIAPAKAILLREGYSDSFIITGPLELFNTYFYISIVSAVALGAPWILYQIWRFVAPGLYERERRFVYLILPLSTTLVIASIIFLFRVALPMTLSFLITFGSDVGQHEKKTADLPPGVVLPLMPTLDADPPAPAAGSYWYNREFHEIRVCAQVVEGVADIRTVQSLKPVGVRPEYRINEYVKLLLALSLAFAAGFQAPVIVLLLGWAGIVTPAFLRKYRKHSFLICAIAAALLTPGDVSSMFAMLVPLYLLFELGIVLLVLFPASKVSGGLTRAQRQHEADLVRSEGGDEDSE